VLGGHYRTRGAIGPDLIRRAYNTDGEPTGYARFEPDPALIANGEQEAAGLAKKVGRGSIRSWSRVETWGVPLPYGRGSFVPDEERPLSSGRSCGSGLYPPLKSWRYATVQE
jgi:hypothetical protein